MVANKRVDYGRREDQFTCDKWSSSSRRGSNCFQKEAGQFADLIPLYDHRKEDFAVTNWTAGSMGVRVMMVTGDHLTIAK
jgi:magnesium-transporting ATPase (P-type)